MICNWCLHFHYCLFAILSFLIFYYLLSYQFFDIIFSLFFIFLSIKTCYWFLPTLQIFKLKFIIFISTSIIYLYLFIKIILSISHHINYYFFHLCISFNLKLPLLIRILLPSILLLYESLHIMYVGWCILKNKDIFKVYRNVVLVNLSWAGWQPNQGCFLKLLLLLLYYNTYIYIYIHIYIYTYIYIYIDTHTCDFACYPYLYMHK
jgi:hypothetical protein